MYDVEKLVSIVCDYLDAEADYMKYSLDARKELGLAPDSTLWIPSLNGSKAYRLGELSEKSVWRIRRRARRRLISLRSIWTQ